MPTRLVQESRHPAGHAGLIVVDPSLIGRDPSGLRLMIVKTGEVESFLDPMRPDDWSTTQVSFAPSGAVATPQGLVFDVDDAVTHLLRANSSYRLRIIDGAAPVLEQGFAMPTSFRRRSRTGASSPPQLTDPITPDGRRAVTAQPAPGSMVPSGPPDSPVPDVPPVSRPLPPAAQSRSKVPLIIAAVALALVAIALVLWFFKPWERFAPNLRLQAPERTAEQRAPGPQTDSREPAPKPPAGGSVEDVSPEQGTPKPSPAPAEAPPKESGAKQAPPDPRTSPPTSSPPANEDQAPSKAPRSSPAPGQSPSAALPQDLATCRGWLQGNPAAADARQLAQQLSAAGRMPDCQLLLSRYAANQGDREGARIMGLMSDPATWSASSSALPAPDAQAAERWYRRAADAGDVESQYRLGMLLKSGRLGAERQSEATQWLRKAAEAGHAASKRELSQ